MEKQAALTHNAFTAITREALSSCVSNTEDITSYSWRRFASTVGLLAKFSAEEKLALSDWQDRVTAGDDARKLAMPLHYSDGKLAFSARTKHLLATVTRAWINTAYAGTVPFATWADIPAHVMREIRMAPHTHRIQLTPPWTRSAK